MATMTPTETNPALSHGPPSVGEPVDSSWAVGDWTFRPLLHRLSQDGRHVRLEPKVSDLLLFLARRARQPVSKDAIFEGVWEQKFLGDSALTRTMAELRRALGDDARTPIYVETIPKHGYRLIAEVRRLQAPGELAPVSLRKGPPENTTPFTNTATGWRRFAPWSAAGVLLVALASLVAVPTFRPTTGASPESLSPGGAAQDVLKLVAVLPLQDLSLVDPSQGPETGDTDDSRNFFAAGMTEALVAHLAQTGAVGVISRHSVDRLLADDGSILDRARSVGIDALVEGTVQRAGDRVRITVRLTELDAGTSDRPTYSWVETYERDVRDVLTLQAEVSRAIAGEVRVALGGMAPESYDPGVPGMVDPRAYELYLQAKHVFAGNDHGKFERAADLFQESIEIDPGYAAAHSGLSRLYARAAEFGKTIGGRRGEDLWHETISESEKALALDGQTTEAYAVRGMVEVLYRWDWQAAERNLRRALQLNPSDAYVRQRFAFFLTFQGRFEEAIREVERAAELDPLSEATFQALAHVYFHAGLYDKVHEVVNRAKERLPTWDSLGGYDTWALAMEGDLGQAAELLAKAHDIDSKQATASLGIYGWVLAKDGRRDEALEIRRAFEQAAHAEPFGRAILEAGLGDYDGAFSALEQALDSRSPSVPYLKVEPFLAPLRDDPRFDAMVSRLGL